MQRTELLIAGIALIIAFFAALGVYHIISKPKDFTLNDCPKLPEYREVLIATKDINLGEVIANGFDYEKWPENSLRQTFYLKGTIDDKKLKTMVARRMISAGEPITQSAIFEGNEHGILSSLLQPGMRAFSINVDPASVSSGLVIPGDVVDVIVTYNSKGTEMETKSKTVLCAIHVLAMDQRIIGHQETAVKKDEALIVPKTATLEVTPAQAEYLSSAVKIGTVSLSLHSIANMDNKCAEIQNSGAENIKIFRGDIAATTTTSTAFSSSPAN